MDDHRVTWSTMSVYRQLNWARNIYAFSQFRHLPGEYAGNRIIKLGSIATKGGTDSGAVHLH